MNLTISISVNDDIELTEIRETDKENLILYLNDLTIFNNTLMIPFPYTMESAGFFVNLCRESEEKRGFITNFAIRKRTMGALIGGCGRFLKETYKDEIGYWIGQPFRNQGIMSAVVGALCTYLYETTELVRIEAFIFADNGASGKTLEKAGFQREGYLRRYIQKGEDVKDVIAYSRLR